MQLLLKALVESLSAAARRKYQTSGRTPVENARHRFEQLEHVDPDDV